MKSLSTNANFVHPAQPTVSHDRGSLRIGPLIGFAAYLTVVGALCAIPTIGPFVAVASTMLIAIAFVFKTIRDDKRLNKEFAAAWWATQDIPVSQATETSTDSSSGGRWSR